MFRRLTQTLLPIALGAIVLVSSLALAAPAAIPQGGTGTAQKIVPIDLNTADAKALAAVPGIGDALAAAIIKARPFKTVDDLKKVKGIGSGSKFDSLKPYFMVAPPPTATPPSTTTTGAGGKSTTGGSKGGSKATTASSAAPTSKLAPGEKININTATATDLDKLPDIGPVKAKAIVDYRTAHGNFATIEDIMKVEGIKEGIFAKIKDLIVVK